MENLETMAVDCDTFDLSLLPLLPVQVSSDDTPFGSSVQISTDNTFESSYMPLEPVQVSTNDTDFGLLPLHAVPPVSTDNSSFDTTLLTLPPVSTDDTVEHNPWALGKLEKFLYYCCPECDERNSSKDAFLQHILNEHPKSKEYFGEFHIKKEIIDTDDYDGHTNGQVEQNKINVNIYYDSTSHMNCSILGKFNIKSHQETNRFPHGPWG